MSRSRLVAVVVALLLGAAVVGLVLVDRPRVQSVDNRWGTVTDNRTEVVTEMRVDNPFLLRLVDGVADVRYTVGLNDIRVASERKDGVRLNGREDTVTASTWIDNGDIPQWWVSHVNRNQTTTVTVDPRVTMAYGGVDVPADDATRRRTFQTEMLEPMEVDRPRQFSAFGRPVIVVNETDVQFGTATRARTPVHASITVTNLLPVPLPITDIQYTTRFNDIVVGEGEAGNRTVIPPGSTRTLHVRAGIDNAKLDEWWVTHRRNGGRTRASLDFTTTVEYGGETRRIPLEFATYNRTFTTSVFGAERTRNDTVGAVDRSADSSARPVSRTSPPQSVAHDE